MSRRLVIAAAAATVVVLVISAFGVYAWVMGKASLEAKSDLVIFWIGVGVLALALRSFLTDLGSWTEREEPPVSREPSLRVDGDWYVTKLDGRMWLCKSGVWTRTEVVLTPEVVATLEQAIRPFPTERDRVR